MSQSERVKQCHGLVAQWDGESLPVLLAAIASALSDKSSTVLRRAMILIRRRDLCRPVLDRQHLISYPSINDAARLLGEPASAIRQGLRGRGRFAKRFVYLDEEL